MPVREEPKEEFYLYLLFILFSELVVIVGRKEWIHGNESERTPGPFLVMSLLSEFVRLRQHKVVKVKFHVIVPWMEDQVPAWRPKLYTEIFQMWCRLVMTFLFLKGSSCWEFSHYQLCLLRGLNLFGSWRSTDCTSCCDISVAVRLM